MPIEDEVVYGFNRQQAQELVSGLGQRDFESQLHPREALHEVVMYRFTLTAAFSSGLADATLKYMDGRTAVDSIELEDVLGAFEGMVSGDNGLCLAQGGKFYVIQAAC